MPPVFLKPALARKFRATISVAQMRLNPAWHVAARGQYDASAIVDAIGAADFGAERAIGVVDADIFVEGMNYVFGLAGGSACIVSMARLRSGDAALFRRRLTKEATHELGHTLGLLHCRDARCVMAYSNSIVGVDAKTSQFCARCREKLALMRD